ncbi:MAG: flagellin [Candidatus Accumulibacter sp.]|jgi:flagellin|uniref:flagellin N-terminal helical domain-containing protein n=1 Tax=Accumulibacter sp. TaxID=2053492 RepID=UPI001ACF68E5|nr:flagellin [Accumulibacter sp.]MBN8437802.1 flagellin [Accumulibacter sp.]
MPQVINTNVSSLNSQRSLNTSQASLTTSLQRLSSGLRINSAKDDAAGLAISARMTSQINGLNQASRNANDGISLAQTAEGGLQSITESLQRMRELSVQASNATNTATDRAALQQEVDTLVQQINTVAGQTAFNGVKLLDGTFNSQSFQVGANTGESITINSIASAKANSLGVGTTSTYTTSESATVTNGAISTGGITVNGYGVGPSVTDGVSSSVSFTSSSAAAANVDIDPAVAAGSSTITAATATTNSNTVAGDLFINGVDIGVITGVTGASTASDQADVVVAAITAAGITNVTAANVGGVVQLTSSDGSDIAVTANAAATTATGLSSTGGAIKINGVQLGAVAAGTTATLQGDALVTAINAQTAKTGVVASNSTGILTLASKDGRDIEIELTGSAKLGSGLTAGTTKVGSDSAIAKAAAFNTVTGQTGVSAVATKTSVTGGVISASAAVDGTTTNYMKINGVKLGAIAAGGNVAAQGNNVVAAINAVSNQTGVTATFDTSTNQLSLAAADGRTITVETKGSAAATNTGFTANTLTNTYGGIKLSSSSSAGITLGGADLANTALSAGYEAATATFGAGIASVDLTTASGAQNAIATIDSALANINSNRANLGAVQNRFSSVVSNLATTSENLSASRSRILDADFASETASLTRSQILQQAGTAMLAQANSLPQNVLSLLRG